MPHSEDELRRMLHRAEQLPYGAAQVALVEEVVRDADAAGHGDLAYEARMLATAAYHFDAAPAKAFTTFTRCLSELDREPRPYHERFAATRLWQFKWMVDAMTRFPEIPLDRTRAVLDDMERRYREGGYSLHAVYSRRYRVAAHVGDWETAEHWYERWCAAPRDELSDCEACDLSTKVWHLATHGRDEEAVALAEPVLRGTFRCPEQPPEILTHLLLPYLRSGRQDEAVTAHRRAYRGMRVNVGLLEPVAEHVTFCGRTGNEVRGLELVQRHLGWLDRAPSPAAAMRFSAAAALVLGRLAAAGRGSLTVRRPAHGDRPAAEVTVAALAAELADSAATLAAPFDARNGTPYHGEQVAATLAAAPLVDQLPLSATRPPRQTPRPRQILRPRQTLRPRRTPATRRSPTGSGSPVGVTGGPAELLTLAEERAMAGDWPGTREVLRTFDDRFAGRDLDPRARATRLDWQGMELLHAGDLSGAADRFRAAAAALSAAGDELSAQAARSRLGALLCWTGQADRGLPLVEESVAYLRVHGDDLRLASALLRRAEVLEQVGRTDQALAAMDEALTYADRSGSTSLAARAALTRSQLTGLDPAERLAAARDARERLRTSGGDGFAQACLWYASLLDDPQQAVPVLEEAVRAVDEEAARVRSALGSALLDSGRPEAAIAQQLEAVALATGDGDRALAAAAQLELGQAYLAAGRPLEAAEAGEESLAFLLAHDDLVAPRDRCRELLFAVYGELGEVTPALEQVDRLLASYQGFGHAGHRGHLQEQAGELLWHAEREAEAAARFTAATTEYAAAGALVDEVRTRRRAMLAHQYGGDPDAATRALVELDSRAATLPGEPEARWEAATARYDGARLLAALGRLPDAARRLEPVAAVFREVDALPEALASELLRGDLLIGAGRAAEAAPVLREVTRTLPRDDQRLPHAAELLAAALESPGGTAEAAEVRRRYGIEQEELDEPDG